MRQPPWDYIYATSLILISLLIKESLDLSAASINHGKAIPVEAFQIMGKPVFGKKLFCWLGNIGFKQMAKRKGTAQHLYDRPYEKEQMI